MIKFFRNIRKRLAAENKFAQYSRYAIGEILLVVIGILIALQINNWNEERTKKAQLKKDLTLVLNNLEEDLSMLESNIRNGKRIVEYHINVLKLSNDSLYPPEKLIDFLGLPVMDQLKIGYNNLLNNNTIQLIENEELKLDLFNYYESSDEFYRNGLERMTLYIETLVNFFLEESNRHSEPNLSILMRKIIEKPLFKEVYSNYSQASEGMLIVLENQKKLLNKIVIQIQKELSNYD